MSEDIASIGFKVDTSDIERGNVALDALASKGEAVDKSVSQVEAAASKTSKSLDNLGRSVHGVNMGGLGGAAQTAATGMGAAGKAAESGATGVKRMADVLGGFSRDTSKAADALGLYASSTKNAIDHQRELERILDRANPSSAAARQLSEEVQTLNRALREGAIGNDTYRASMRNAFDEAEKAAGGVSKVGTAASMVTGLLTKLAGAAAVAVAFSFGKFISETIAAEQAQAQLQAVLKSTGESAGWTSDQLNAMAQGLASKSIFSVDQIKAAETRLLSYTGIVGQQFPRAMQAVIDMSSRMGMEVTSAAEQIGRALDIPSQGLTALTRQGFRFTEEQKEMVKQLEETGRVAEAQAIVLSAVESSYGGAAEAARGTFGGALKELQKNINDVMTGEGAGVEGMTRGINNLSSAIGSDGTRKAFQLFIGWISDVSAAAIRGAANLVTFLNASNKLRIIAGTDGFGAMKANAAEYGRQLEQLTSRAEGYSDAIRRGFNVEWNQRNLNKTREMIARVQKQAQDATQQLKDFANAQEGKPTSTDYGAPDAGAMERAKADAIAKADAASADARIDALNKLMGVNSNYQEELKKTQAAFASGAITQEEYVASLKKLATETWAATDAGKAAAEASKAGTKARDEAAKATQREAEAYGSFISSVQSKIAAIDLELAGGAKLTESQRLQLQLQKMIADGKVKESRAEQEATKALLAGLSAKEDALKLQTAQSKALEESAKAYDTYIKSQQNAVRADVEKNNTLRLEIEAMGLTKRELLALNRSRMDEQIVALQAKHSLLTLAGARDDETKVIREQIKALQDRKELLGQQFEKQEMLDAQQEMTDTWTSIDRTAHDVFVNIFEDGAGTFKRLGQTLKSALLDMLYQLTVKRWIINIGASFGATGGIFGDGQGGAGSLLGTASNLNTAWGMLSGTGGNMGALTGLMSGSMSWANAMGSVYANTTGTGISGLLATNGAYGTAGGAGAGLGATAAGIAAVAAPLIIGSLIERNSRDRFSGAAYATSGGNDPFVNTVAGSTGFNYLTGDLPDRAALMARLEELGAPMEAISDWNDRALLRLMESAAADNSEFGINWTSRVRDMRDTPDFYRGAGYAHPEELGWWNNKDNANLSTDPALIQASRDIALSIIGPLEGIGALIGDEAAYRATVGFANRGEGNGLWAGMNLQRDGQNVADWVNTDDFHSVGEAVRAMYSTALGTLDSFDLPGWADKQVTDARTALDALSGDKIGEQAAALYQQATGGISATFAAIEKMINLFPDFAEASQDAVYALGELTGGLDNLASAYGSYLSNFYSEEERRQLMFKELDSELDKLGIDTIPRTRAEFRELVSAQDLSTEAGREAFTVLMKLSGGFAEFVDAAESAADNARERIDSIFGQISKLWDEQISNWSKLSSEAKSVFDAAIKAAKDLRGQVADTRQWDARAANAYIDQALAGLRATGALPDSKELADAIAAARGGLDMSQYDTVAEMERDQLILAGKLNEIGDSAEVQMSFAEQQVQLLEQQRDYWRQQIDLLTATGETITSIDQGIEYLADYVREQAALKAAEEAEKEAAREAARRAARRGDWGGGGGGGQDLTSITRTINWETGEYVYPDGSGGTMSAAELERFRKIRDGELDPFSLINELYKVPRHADGGRYAGGLALVGERGPELINFASPGHVYTAVQTRDMMRGGDNAELIAELRELRARLDKIERNTAVLPQTHDVIDRVTAGGNAMLTEAA